MTDTATEDLTAAGALDGTELLHLVQGGNSRKATVAEVTGQASVVLADIDLSARDMRSGQNPLVVTGIDAYERIDIMIDATAATNTEMFLELSNDNGANFRAGASDYGRTFYNSALQSSDANAAFLGVLGSGASTSSGTMASLYGCGRASIQTMLHSHITAAGNALTGVGRNRTREVNNAFRIYSAATTTAGRLVVIGYR